MSYEKCPTCGRYDFTERHSCPDKFYFKHPDWGDERVLLYAYSHEEAAKAFAEKYFEDEPIDPSWDTEVIISDGKQEKTFRVHAEIDVEYYANEVEQNE